MPSLFPQQKFVQFCSTQNFTRKIWEKRIRKNFLRTDICLPKVPRITPNKPLIQMKGGLFLPNFCSQIFWSFNWRPCCFLVHLEITHFEQVKRLPPLPTFPMWLDQWSKIHSPCHPRCRAILRCINSTKPPQPTFVLEEETNPPTEKKEVKKTQWLSQVISQDIFTTWCGIYDHRLEKK